jgi:hypothetical protein
LPIATPEREDLSGRNPSWQYSLPFSPKARRAPVPQPPSQVPVISSAEQTPATLAINGGVAM